MMKELTFDTPRIAKPALAGLWALFVLVSISSAEVLQGERAVEAGRDALAGRNNYPWYDEDNDSIRRIDVETPKEAAAHRGSKWQAKPAAPSKKDFSWLAKLMAAIWKVVGWLFWVAIAALFAFLVVLLVRAFMNSGALLDGSSDEEQEGDSRSEADLIESLPFQVKRPQGDLLAEARRHYEQGNYGEAIIYLFSYQLVKLDRHNFIRLARGKTNRQYLREIFPQPDLRKALERSMVAFEDVFFGHHPLERERFESCWLRLDEFHEHVEQAAI